MAAHPLPDQTGPYRVVQWATGNIGRHALRRVIEHPAMALTGVYVTNPDKVGKDAGELCGLDPTGVTATGDIEDVVALGADCVLYMPRHLDLDEVCRLLKSGANVVTTRGEFHRPASMDPAVRERVAAACEKGATSIHSTGSSPGFISEALPLVLSSVQRELTGLHISEFADMTSRDSPEMIFEIMGFGKPVERYDERRLEHLRAAFGPSLELMADALGVVLDSVEVSGELATATERVEIAAGAVEAGTVAAQRTTISGMLDGRPLLSFSTNWYCTTDTEPAWDLRPSGWHVTVVGDAPLDIDIRIDVPLDRMATTTPGYTANRAVNAVPVVCGAAPGIRTTLDLPQIIAALT